MSGDPTTAPAEAADPLHRVKEALEADPSALGERLLVLGTGPIPVQGALGGVLALDARGSAVLIAAFDKALPEGATGELADELDRLANLDKHNLGKLAGDGELAKAHSEFFGLTNGSHLNRRQKAVVVLAYAPDLDTWKDLRVDLGPNLSAVFVAREELEAEPPPPQLGRRVNRRWVIATALVFGLLGALVGRVTKTEPPIGEGPNISAGSLVSAGAGVDATHTQWVGQRRLVRNSEGRLIAAFAAADGLKITEDQLNQGKSWLEPTTITEVRPVSFSIAIDGEDRIHVAFKDAEGVGYLNIAGTPEGLTPTPVVRVATDVTAPIVDIGFDRAAHVAHVVWVSGETDQEPMWASIDAPVDAEPSLIRTESLAPAGHELSALVNVGVAPDGQVVATYRRADSAEGWFARYLAGDAWAPEERLPTPDVLYGAASLVVDQRGTAHLVLRDNSDYGLTYFRRFQGAWSGAEPIVDAERTEQIDFPSISADDSSEILYVVYEDTVADPKGEVKLTSRDPAAGWSTPAGVGSPEGLRYPTALASTLGNNLFLATAQGGAPQALVFRAGPG